MGTLTTKVRDKLAKSDFGLPETRSYPMPDKAHARNAKARAAQQAARGNLTPAEQARINAKADRILNGRGS
jgi:hypothetical protein